MVIRPAAIPASLTVAIDLTPGCDNYCVFGNPIAHSKSPRIHAEFARQTGQAIAYAAVLVPLNAFAETVETFRRLGGKGANVTLPFKQQAWQLSTRRSERADLAGAVNTLTFDESGDIIGDNTDGAGLVRDFTVNQHGRLEAQEVLMLGAGGAARGVLPALLQASPRRLVIANRTPGKAIELAAAFTALGDIRGVGFDDLGGQSFDVIINATAASLEDTVPPLPAGALRPGGWCYDLMYAQAATAFVRWGLAHGASRSVDGLGMLVEQAAESFLIWRGMRPDTRPVLAALRGGSSTGPTSGKPGYPRV